MTVVTTFFWLVALALFYFLCQDQPYVQENIAAGVFAACATAVVMVAAANWGSGVRLPARKLLELVTLPKKMLVGVFVVNREIARAAVTRTYLRARMARQPFRYGKRDDGADIGRRALETYIQCITPNTMLVAFLRDRDEIVTHRMR